MLLAEILAVYRRGMKDLQQLLYPWVQYYCIKNHNTNIQTVCSPWDIEINSIDPYFMYPVKKILLWSGKD